jgi:hypothetical protein
LGVGSCFKVILPFLRCAEGSVTEQLPQKAMDSWDGPVLRILLVEDNPINITFGMALLRKLGHDVVSAVNCRDCLAKLQLATRG